MNENAKAVDVRAVLDCAAEQVITRAVCISSANRFGTAKQLRQASAISHRRCVMSRNEEAANRGLSEAAAKRHRVDSWVKVAEERRKNREIQAPPSMTLVKVMTIMFLCAIAAVIVDAVLR